VASRFAAAGIETHAIDLRGFGASAGSRAYVDRWSHYHDDVEDQLTHIRATSEGLPVVLYGHSMGGLIALGYVLADPPRIQPDLLVLSAPAIAARVATWKRMLADVLGRLAPRLEIPNELPRGALSHDPQVEDAYRIDPLNHHRTTTRLGLELFREQARVQKRLVRLGKLPVPTYVLHGSGDRVVPVEASAGLDGKGNATRRVYEGLHHEMHNEPEAAAIIDDTIAWIDAQL
jgi:alpha-beta hydrolase superfamily lysophospholipase